MPTNVSIAGTLHYRVGFYQRGSPGSGSPPPPDYGNPIGGYPDTATFVVWGNIEPKLGGEAVLAARLTGKNYANITVRRSLQTDQVDVDWKCKNEQTGEEYNIRSIIDPKQGGSGNNTWWEMLCEKGVAI